VPERVLLLWKFDRTTLSRGSKSRNKVSVGEPAEGSLPSYKSTIIDTRVRPLLKFGTRGLRLLSVRKVGVGAR
jgi:hypothetical protein